MLSGGKSGRYQVEQIGCFPNILSHTTVSIRAGIIKACSQAN